MKIVMCCFLLVNTSAMGYTGCKARGRETLICIFPSNVNSTQSDFGVYFYYDDGGEEPLVDCAWTKSHLHCIKQKGFECKHPVSDTAEIIVPKSFGDKKGSYRCVSDGNRHNNIKSCRLPDMGDHDFSSTCEVKAGSNYQVTLKCIFSFNVIGFNVTKSGIVVANYTRSSCHNSTSCEHNLKHNNEIFMVKLVVTEFLYNDYYYCLPNNLALRDSITGCSLVNNANDESVTTLIYLAALSFVPVGIVAVVIIKLTLLKSRDKSATKV